MSGDLVDRFEAWVARVVADGSVWIVLGEDDFNTVLEDPDQPRDLQLLYASQAEADAAAERPAGAGQNLRPDAVPVEELPALCDAAEERGEGFALWEAENWIVAEPNVLREELEERLAG